MNRRSFLKFSAGLPALALFPWPRRAESTDQLIASLTPMEYLQLQSKVWEHTIVWTDDGPGEMVLWRDGGK